MTVTDDALFAPRWFETWEEVGNRHGPWWLRVCDKTGDPLELVTDPQSASFTLRHGTTGTGSVTLPSKHARTPEMMADGARYRINSTLTGELLTSGTVRGYAGQGHPDTTQGGQIGSATWTLVDDHSVLSDWNVAPPTGKDRFELRGAAETVARTLITATAARLGIPLFMAASAGRGSDVVVSVRWQPISDALYPAITTAGIGLRVTWDHVNGRYVVQAYEPTIWPKTISTFSGVVDSWDWSSSYPGSTRAVVLGPREGKDRLVRTVVNTGLESALNAIRENVVDASDISDVDAESVPARILSDVHADMDSRGQEKLDEDARTVGLRLALASVPELAFGRAEGLKVGDILRTTLIPARPEVLVPITALNLSWGVDGGFLVTPEAGEWDESSSRVIARRIKDLAVGWRRQKARL